MAPFQVGMSAVPILSVGPGIAASGASPTLSALTVTRLGLLIGLPNAPATSLTVTINGVDPTGNLYPLVTSAALAAATSVQLSVGPGMATTANISAAVMVPALVVVSWVAVGASVGATLTLYGR